MNHEEFRQAIVRASNDLASAGVLSASRHGNWSVRIPGTDTMLLTGSSLSSLDPTQMALLSLDGEILEGSLAPVAAEIVQMHACVYRERPEVGSVVHTHSPFTTAFAVAGRPLEAFAEALVRNSGSTEPVPVAPYAPRGSDEAVANIVTALKSSPHQRAVLLGNHGLLAFGADVAGARGMVFATEEAAYAAILASAIGTPQVIPAHLAVQADQRRREFDAAGPMRAS
jgi:L-ribulose-5-phosphate 4-epimerase